MEQTNIKLVSEEEVTGLAQKIVDRSIVPEGCLREGTNIWDPSEEEFQPCCKRIIRKLSKRNPKVLYNHCQTVEHLSKKYDIPYRDLKAAVRKIRGVSYD